MADTSDIELTLKDVEQVHVGDVSNAVQIHHFPPPKRVVDEAYIKSIEEYKAMYDKSIKDPDTFWAEIAENNFVWHRKWDEVSRWNLNANHGTVDIKWFLGGKTNVCFNALDRHVQQGRGNQVAFFWEGNDVGESKVVTYKQLLDEVCKLANVLRSFGVKKGDCVALYLPMIVELPIALLACARIGAVHSAVFAGFSSINLANRMLDSQCRIIITADGVLRGPKPIHLKDTVDEAIAMCAKNGLTIEKCLVYRRLGTEKLPIQWNPAIDLWWHDTVTHASTECPVCWQDSEDPLFMLYTSGSTGKPKGVIHTTGGYMVYASTTFKYVFDYHPGDIFFCTADIGWITGHSYVVYGPLCNCATSVIYEGIPVYPHAGRFWEICEKYSVTQFYTAPTAIRALMKAGNEIVRRFSRRTIRILGTVGEPINPEAWLWYHQIVGDSRCAIVDTWWQTETGGIMITPLPGCTVTKPGSATFPFFGVQPVLLDEKGNELEGAISGYLAIRASWPGSMRTIYGDHDRFESTYFRHFPGYYLTGDGCKRDSEGYYWLTGRVDDVMNVAGHRIGTAEVESALVGFGGVIEAAVVPVPHELKGEGIYVYVTLTEGVTPNDELKQQLIAQVRRVLGPIATPDVIHWAPGLPKTRSGKIMRRILRKIAEGIYDSLGDISTLADPSVIETLIQLKGK